MKGVHVMDKVKFGIKNVHIFPITAYVSAVPVYGTVIPIPGAVSLSRAISTSFTPTILCIIRRRQITGMKAI